MKRKLTKRNKQFLSSRIMKYTGDYSFQCLTRYRRNKDMSQTRVKKIWKWFYSTKYIENIFGEALIKDYVIGD